MAHFLITGGAGFIGSHLAGRLDADGHRVRILDDFSTGHRKNLLNVEQRAEIIEGSILDKEHLRACMKDVDYVLHQAAFPSVLRSIENPEKSLEVNGLGTLQVLSAALQAKVKRVVIASSSSVYGDSVRLPKEESMETAPVSPYAVGKLAAEHYAYVYHKVHGLETISLRYFNVFGPRQNALSAYAAVIPNFIAAMTQGRSPQIYGDGKRSRDFTYVENVVHANLLACEAPAKACGATYNIATGKRVSLLSLVEQLNEILGTRMRPDFCPSRPGDVKHSQADIRRAARSLHYQVSIPFTEGLCRTVQSYNEAMAYA